MPANSTNTRDSGKLLSSAVGITTASLLMFLPLTSCDRTEHTAAPLASDKLPPKHEQRSATAPTNALGNRTPAGKNPPEEDLASWQTFSRHKSSCSREWDSLAAKVNTLESKIINATVFRNQLKSFERSHNISDEQLTIIQSELARRAIQKYLDTADNTIREAPSGDSDFQIRKAIEKWSNISGVHPAVGINLSDSIIRRKSITDDNSRRDLTRYESVIASLPPFTEEYYATAIDSLIQMTEFEIFLRSDSNSREYQGRLLYIDNLVQTSSRP